MSVGILSPPFFLHPSPTANLLKQLIPLHHIFTLALRELGMPVKIKKQKKKQKKKKKKKKKKPAHTKALNFMAQENIFLFTKKSQSLGV
jgi:hypothetical protein